MKSCCVVGGAGHIGFPLSLALANAGFEITILDPSKNVELIRRGEAPYKEEGVERYLRNSQLLERITAETDMANINSVFDVIVVTLGTPVDEWGNPNNYDLLSIVESHIPLLKHDGLMVLRSTILPGFTDQIRDKFSINASFCPERITQGNSFVELSKLPQIIGAASDLERKLSEELFGNIVPSFVHVSSKEAELAKILCNFYRYANFGIANSIYNLCEEIGVNSKNVFDAIKKDYPRAQCLPHPGLAAGPCLYKDTKQLNALFPEFRLGSEIIAINEGMAINLARKAVLDPDVNSVLILGAAFKANCDDFRDSLSFKIRKFLYLNGVDLVEMYDPLVDHPFVQKEQSYDQISQFDRYILATRHDCFEELIERLPDEKLIKVD